MPSVSYYLHEAIQDLTTMCLIMIEFAGASHNHGSSYVVETMSFALLRQYIHAIFATSLRYWALNF